MKWADAHRIAMIEATHAHHELHLDVSTPIDVFDAIRRQRLLLAFEYFPRLSGVYVADPVAPGIAVSAQHGLARQRYTAAHELAHHRFGHGTTVDPEIDPLSSWGSAHSQLSDAEKLAEAFAAWFLMPRRLVASTLNTLGLTAPTTPAHVYQLSLRLGTSYRATVRHLPNLKLASQMQARQWLTVAPRSLKQQLLPDVDLDFRRDVWHLSTADGGHRYWVRPGDRLLVTVAETPSSGYVWHIGDAEKILAAAGSDTHTDAAATGVANDDPATWPVGAQFTRTVALRVEVTEERLAELDAAGVDHLEVELAAALRQPWDEATAVEQFRVALDIRPPRRGIDPEALLAA